MTFSSLPPPPPRPPHTIPPPPAPTAAATGASWKDLNRPPSVPYPESSRWGLGDAFIASGIYFFSSVVLFVTAVLVFDVDPLDGWWFPFTLIVPQLLQLTFVIWTSRTRGSGLSIDFGFAFASRDLAIGAMLFFVGLVAASVVGLIMVGLGVDPPTAAVAELTEEAADTTDVPDSSSAPADAASNATDHTNDAGSDARGITLPIVVVAILAATAVPLAEEVGYRGLWYSAVAKRGHSEWWAVIVSSTVFAVAHLEPARTPIIFALGVVLGWGRMLTNRLGAGIVAHAVFNGLAFTALLANLA